MTCVACSQTIEGAMKNQFGKLGLIQCQVALLTHKMRMEFSQAQAKKHKVTGERIVQEVESVGFGAELIETIINDQHALLMNQSNTSIINGEEVDTLQ